METLKKVLRLDRYDRLEGSEALLDPQSEKTVSEEKVARRPYLTGFTLVNLTILLLNVSWFWYNIGSRDHRRNHQIRDCSFFSPIFDRVDITSTPKQINGTLADEHVGYHAVTSADVAKLGKDPTTTVRAPAEWGLGDDAHLVQLDLAHQLHCLDVVRKAMYPDYYAERALLRGVHAQHCVDVLLQNLLCDASVDVYTHNWVETQRHPFPDMSLNRQCRDFDAVLAWHHENLIPWTRNVTRPADATVLPMPQRLKEHWSQFQTDHLHG
ncbi:hypothetical protein PG987_001093 [Apiospora arundinis]